MKKFIVILMAVMLTTACYATQTVWTDPDAVLTNKTGEIKDADVMAGSNGVYNHLARTTTISLETDTGLSAYDTSSTSACSSSLLGDRSDGIVPPFKMRIYNASTTPVIYRTIYSNSGGTVATATSLNGFVPFTSQVYEEVFFSVPNWTLSPSANATLTVEIFTKGY